MDSAEYFKNNDSVRWQLLYSAGSCTGSDWVTLGHITWGSSPLPSGEKKGGGGGKVLLAQDAR